jgi:hypothetical protein
MSSIGGTIFTIFIQDKLTIVSVKVKFIKMVATSLENLKSILKIFYC